MNCKELVYMLGDYFDGAMDARLREELDAHVAKCGPCVAFLRTYGKTRQLCRELREEEIPADLKERLKVFVLEKAKAHHRDIERYLAKAAAERRREVEKIIRADVEDRLSPTLSAIFESHRGRCPVCGTFLRKIKEMSGGALPEPPPGVEEHIADFLEALPPGEAPVVSS